MNSAVTQENLKAIGVLVAAFLASIVVASFLYIQPGSAEASSELEPCSSTAVVEDVPNRDGTVKINIEITSGCKPENLIVSTLSQEGFTTVIREIGATSLGSNGYKYELTLEIYDYVEAYRLEIPGAFSGSIVS